MKSSTAVVHHFVCPICHERVSRSKTSRHARHLAKPGPDVDPTWVTKDGYCKFERGKKD